MAAGRGLSLRMVRPDLENIPQFGLPEGFSVRRYRSGDEEHWTAIHVLADKLNVITAETFTEAFGRDVDALRRRQYYLCDAAGSPVGTATAWAEDDGVGRVHWVAILPAFQGRGLSKPLMTTVCNRLRELGHDQAWLSTQTLRIPAIGLYLKFGFVPDIRGPEEARAWQQVRRRLPDSPLAEMPLGEP